MVEKWLAIPFMFVLAVVFLLVGLLAYYGPSGGNADLTTSTSQTAHIQSAVLDDLTNSASAPCSATGLNVTCAPTFAIKAGDSVQVTVIVEESASDGSLSWQAQHWNLVQGLNTIQVSIPDSSFISLQFSAS